MMLSQPGCKWSWEIGSKQSNLVVYTQTSKLETEQPGYTQRPLTVNRRKHRAYTSNETHQSNRCRH